MATNDSTSSIGNYFFPSSDPSGNTTTKDDKVDPKKAESKEDPKKVKNDDGNSFSQLFTFFKSLISNILSLIIVFVIGTMVLYSCKIAQTGIIPVDDKNFPYKGDSCDFKPTEPVNINPFTNKDGTKCSQRIFVDEYVKNVDSKFFKYFREIDPNNSGFYSYILTIIQKIIIFNFIIEDTIWNFFNKNLYEIVIIFIVPYCLPFITFFILFINYFYFFYVLFSAMNSVFKDSVYYYFWLVFVIILAISLLFSPIHLVICVIALIYVILQPILTTASKQLSDGKSTKYTFSSFFFDTITYKSSIIMHILTIVILYSTLISFKNPIYCAISICITLLFYILFYFKILPGKIYEPVIPEGDTFDILSYDKYDFTCKTTAVGMLKDGINSGINSLKNALTPSKMTRFGIGAGVAAAKLGLRAAPTVIKTGSMIANIGKQPPAPPAEPAQTFASKFKNRIFGKPKPAAPAAPPAAAPPVVQGAIVAPAPGPAPQVPTVVSEPTQAPLVPTVVSEPGPPPAAAPAQAGGARKLINFTQNIHKINKILEN